MTFVLHICILLCAVSFLVQSTEGLTDDPDREQTRFRRFFLGESSKKHPYTIEVSTSKRRGAATDANVFIDIQGSKTTASKVKLNNFWKNNFEKGKIDIFKETLDDLGDIKKITIGHDNSGIWPKWIPESVRITAPDGKKYKFVCKDCILKKGSLFKQLFPVEDIPVVGGCAGTFADASHCWPFDNEESNLSPDLKGGISAKLEDGARIADSALRGKVATTLEEGSWIDMGDFRGKCISDPSLCNNGVTIMFWAKIERTDAAKNPTLPKYVFSSGGDDIRSRGFSFFHKNDIYVLQVANGAQKWRDEIPDSKIPFDSWFSFAFTWNQVSGLAHFINGKADGLPLSQPSNVPIPHEDDFNDLRISKSNSNNRMGEMLPMKLDQFVTWGRILQLNEISKAFNEGGGLPAGGGTSISLQACQSSPCHNGGVCKPDDDDPQGYRCVCPAGYAGLTCEIEGEGASKGASTPTSPTLPGASTTAPTTAVQTTIGPSTTAAPSVGSPPTAGSTGRNAPTASGTTAATTAPTTSAGPSTIGGTTGIPTAGGATTAAATTAAPSTTGSTTGIPTAGGATTAAATTAAPSTTGSTTGIPTAGGATTAAATTAAPSTTGGTTGIPTAGGATTAAATTAAPSTTGGTTGIPTAGGATTAAATTAAPSTTGGTTGIPTAGGATTAASTTAAPTTVGPATTGGSTGGTTTKGATTGTVTPTASPTPTLKPEPAIEQLIRDIMAEISKFRRLHQSPGVTPSEKLHQIASRWAQKIAAQGVEKIDPNSTYGQLVCSHNAGGNIAKACTVKWYGAVMFYDWADPKLTIKASPFTQMVWKKNSYAGVGIAKGGGGIKKQNVGGKLYVVVLFDPGQSEGENIRDNVRPAAGISEPAPEATCPQGYSKLPQGSRSCFSVNAIPLTWNDALYGCALDNGTLASLQCKEEADLVVSLLTKSNVSEAWIGLHDHSAEGRYVWVDGSPIPFSEWLQGEPNGDASENCIVQAKGNYSSGWADRHCFERKAFVCEVPAPGYTTYKLTFNLTEPQSQSYQNSIGYSQSLYPGSYSICTPYVQTGNDLLRDTLTRYFQAKNIFVQPIVNTIRCLPNGTSVVEVIVRLGPEAGSNSISSLQTSIKGNDGELELSNGASARLVSVEILTPGTPYCPSQCASSSCQPGCDQSCCTQPSAAQYQQPVAYQQPYQRPYQQPYQQPAPYANRGQWQCPVSCSYNGNYCPPYCSARCCKRRSRVRIHKF